MKVIDSDNVPEITFSETVDISEEGIERIAEAVVRKLREKERDTNNTYDMYWNTIPPACRNCSNHPINGGSGICHCVLGVQTIY